MKLKNMFKLPIRFSEIDQEIRIKMIIRIVVAVLIIIASGIVSIILKDAIYVISFAILGVALIATALYTVYLFCKDEVYIFKGKVVKIVNKNRLKRKYKDVYLKSDESTYCIIEVPKSKSEYQLGTTFKLYITTNQYREINNNTIRVRTPLLTINEEAEYVEGETSEAKENHKKIMEL